MLNTQGRVLNTLTEPCQDSLGNSGDPNVRVTVAVENRDGIDGHRHTHPTGGTIALVMQYYNRAPPGEVSRTPSVSSYGMDVPDYLRQRADSRRARRI